MQPARSLPRTAGGSFLCRQARGMAARGRGFSCGSGGSLAVGRCAGCSFPLAGKNQWAIRGSLFEPARALPTGTPPLGFRKESGAAQGCRFPRRAAWNKAWLCTSSAGSPQTALATRGIACRWSRPGVLAKPTARTDKMWLRTSAAQPEEHAQPPSVSAGGRRLSQP